LYAQWEETNSYKLFFNYGIAHDIAEKNSYPTSTDVVYNQNIGALPSVPTIIVKAKDVDGIEKECYPYYGGGWYKTPILTDNGEPLYAFDHYWTHHDSSAYLLYNTRKYACTVSVDGKLYSKQDVAYGDTMPLPQLVDEGMTFDGWYRSPWFDESTKWSGTTMPPFDITLYARWLHK
jgi:uncharacterized repeat protein (TIGR02543 family)